MGSRSGTSAAGGPSYKKYTLNPIYELKTQVQCQVRYVLRFLTVLNPISKCPKGSAATTRMAQGSINQCDALPFRWRKQAGCTYIDIRPVFRCGLWGGHSSSDITTWDLSHHPLHIQSWYRRVLSLNSIHIDSGYNCSRVTSISLMARFTYLSLLFLNNRHLNRWRSRSHFQYLPWVSAIPFVSRDQVRNCLWDHGTTAWSPNILTKIYAGTREPLLRLFPTSDFNINGEQMGGHPRLKQKLFSGRAMFLWRVWVR